MHDERILGVRRKMGFTDNFNVLPVGFARALSMWWDESVKVTVLRSSQNMIDTKVEIIQTSQEYRATWIYGTPYRDEKVLFWRWLGNILSACMTPWFCGGDLNEILWSHEEQGGTALSPNRQRFP